MTSSRPPKPPRRADLVISSYDKRRLLDLLGTDREAAGAATADDLREEVERGAEVRPEDVPPDVVTMNSRVRVRDLETGRVETYTIVFPAEADPMRGRLSILNPLAVELIGCRAGDEVTVARSGGHRRFRIEEILYQPEAAGDFHL